MSARSAPGFSCPTSPPPYGLRNLLMLFRTVCQHIAAPRRKAPRLRWPDERATPAGGRGPRLHPPRRRRQRGLPGGPQGPQGHRLLLPRRPDPRLHQAGLRLHRQPGGPASAGYDVIGISPDAPEKLAKFREKESLKVTLLADPDKRVTEAYAAYGEKKNYGKTYLGVIRSTIVVDEEGKVSHASTRPRHGPRSQDHQGPGHLSPHPADGPHRNLPARAVPFPGVTVR